MALVFLLAGCQTPPQTRQLLAQPPDIPRHHLIAGVPFYPQQEFYCGPTTLAEVAAFYGKPQDPSTIAPQTFIPKLQGSLQIEMAAATRQLGLLAYAQKGTMQQLLRLVADNMPVIVLQNNALSWWPQWHYAVVIGYDLNDETLTLHTGVTPNYQLDFSTFERTWQRGGHWFLLMLPSDKTSPELDPFLYTKAAQELLVVQQLFRDASIRIRENNSINAGVHALQSATKQWPNYWLPYFLLANHYAGSDGNQDSAEALQWFAKGFKAGRQQIEYLNNYALLLSSEGCLQAATALLGEALRLAPGHANLLDSLHLIQQQHSRPSVRTNSSTSEKSALICPELGLTSNNH